MEMSNKRIIEYDAASEARTDDNLLMDSPAVGTRKITATNLIKPAMDAVSAESTARQNGDTNLDGKKYGDFVSTTNVTIDGVIYKTFWVIAPTSSNQVYGIANHPTNGKLYKIYNNNGTYTAEPYDLNATKGDEISTKDGQTGTIQTGVVSTIAANTSLDNAILTLLNNDVTQDKQISDIESNLTELVKHTTIEQNLSANTSNCIEIGDLKIQFGTQQCTANVYTNITFKKPFSSTGYVCFASYTSVNATALNNPNASVTAQTTTGAKIYSSGGKYGWVAIGY